MSARVECLLLQLNQISKRYQVGSRRCAGYGRAACEKVAGYGGGVTASLPASRSSESRCCSLVIRAS
jgi:hypothetical protein